MSNSSISDKIQYQPIPWDIAIVGSGPAGYTAAIYAGRAGRRCILIEGMQPGGQLTTTTHVENYPGFPEGIDANVLMEHMREQSMRIGTKFMSNEVQKTDFSSKPYSLTLDNGTKIEAKTVIIATGASAKYLGMSDEEKYKGLGVSACATCDGFFFRKKTVAVVGGGETACEEATYLAGLANKVYMIVRKPALKASAVMVDRVLKNEKIEILFETNTIGLYGDKKLQGAHLVYRRNLPEERYYDLPIDGLFLAIGHKPNSEPFLPWLQTDEQGYILTPKESTSTNIPGIFAAGDVADPIYQQAVVAAGSGAKAAIEADKYLRLTYNE